MVILYESRLCMWRLCYLIIWICYLMLGLVFEWLIECCIRVFFFFCVCLCSLWVSVFVLIFNCSVFIFFGVGVVVWVGSEVMSKLSDWLFELVVIVCIVFFLWIFGFVNFRFWILVKSEDWVEDFLFWCYIVCLFNLFFEFFGLYDDYLL